MAAHFELAVPVLPAADVAVSLQWWTQACGFSEVFHHGEPPVYAGLARDGIRLHLAAVDDPPLARTVGDQTMLRLQVAELEAFYETYQQNGGIVHPNGSLARTPWGSLEFAAIDPCGVCVTFFE